MQKFFIFIVGVVVTCISWFGSIRVVHAETVVPGTVLYEDTVWNREGSPYILTGPVTVPYNKILTITEGVEVRADLTVTEDPLPALFVESGSLLIRGGSGDAQVTLRDLDGVFINHGHVDMRCVHMIGPNGIVIENSTGTIATSTIERTYAAVRIKESTVSIVGTTLQGNTRGIVVEPEGVPDLVYGVPAADTGGVGNALEESPLGHTNVTISHSIIENNDSYAVRNEGTSTVVATHNWWGTTLGPETNITTNKIAGYVDYQPWLDVEPDLAPRESLVCCSSVLFIPGLQASRLYQDVPNTGGTRTNTLWEPNRKSDVEKLFLNADGTSVGSTIYSNEPIGRAFGMVGVYGSFLDFLEEMKRGGYISAWNVFGYDWRKSIPEVVAGREKRATSTESLVEVVEHMASTSPTGKVTLIAHSNGGLVAKYLVKALVDMGKEYLIDSVISVAVPYLGTPEALLGLLHGDNQSMLGGLIVDQAHMRGLGLNMASAYSLLPSGQLFQKAFGPTIAFASTTIPGLNNRTYEAQLDSVEQQDAFIVDADNSRIQPSFTDTDRPSKGNNILLTAARTLHAILDPFVWPSTIMRWALVGWNVDTTKGVIYDGHHSCGFGMSGYTCSDEIVRSATTTNLGDGTVVVSSATHMSGQVIALDLAQASQEVRGDIVHRNILEASSTQAVIKSILTRTDLADDGARFDLPHGASWGEPDSKDDTRFVIVSTHSPVELHIYDAHGNHTGLVPKPSQLVGNDVVTGAYETDIPGSSFRMFGSGGSHDTYIHLPLTTNEMYSVIVEGTDFGTFTLDVETFEGEVSLGKTEYSELPVTPVMIATSSVGATTTMVSVDFDGDTRPDFIAKPGMATDPYLQAEAIKSVIRKMLGTDPRATKLIKRIDKVVALLREGKEFKAKKRVEKIVWRLGHKKFKDLSGTDRDQILRMMEQLFESE